MTISSKIDALMGGFSYLMPEMIMVIGAILLVMYQLIQPEGKEHVKTFITCIVLTLAGWLVINHTVEGSFMNGVLWQSHVIRLFKLFFLLITIAVLFFENSKTLKEKGEYHFLLLMILLGSFMVMQSANLLVFYIAVEIISITSYVLITFNFDKKSFEAGIKYLLFGAMASGLMLYGISLLYGMSGSLDIADLFMVTSSQINSSTWLTLAIVLFFSGLFFKLALVPMHIWTPDAYQAGPTSVVGLISILPKIAILIFFYQLIQFSGLDLISFDWKRVLSILAMISMFVGNLAALKQTNVKRMLAYSTIAHSGFLVIGIIVGSEFSIQAMLFYAIVYGLMNIGIFYFVSMMEASNINAVSQLAGTGKQQPYIGTLVVFLLISLVGLPPTGGFTAKLLLFSSLWEYYQLQGDSVLLWLLVLGVGNAAISLFYYLKIPYFMFIKSGDNQVLQVKYNQVVYLSIVTVLIIIIFFKPDLLLNMLNQINFAL